MSIKVIRDERILRFVFSESTPRFEMYADINREFGDAPPDLDLLWDVRESTSLAGRTTEFVHMIAQFVVEHPGRPGRRLAVLLPSGERERWEKITQQLAHGGEVEIALFEDEAAAMDWFQR
jgi:hypothetical protein